MSAVVDLLDSDQEKPLKMHQPCPDCGSSDALAIYSDHTYCFSCGKATKTSPGIATLQSLQSPAKTHKTIGLPLFVESAFYSALPKRGLTRATCERYDARYVQDDQLIAFVYRNEEGNPVAAKLRTADKEFKTVGDWSKTAPLWGMNLFPAGGRTVMITEGEFDAMAAFQMQGSKWPCVSVKNGATGAVKDCQRAYKWLDSFETIVVCFDDDEPGKRAARDVAELFVGKSKIVKHVKGHKDANDYLMAGDEKEFIDAFWRAEVFSSDGIVNMQSIKDKLKERPKQAPVDYPWEGVNKLTYGIRFSELVTVAAGSGLGKSQFIREVSYHILRKTEDKIGLLILEEDDKRTSLGLMSIAANKPLHLPTTEYTDEEWEDAWKLTGGTGRVVLFNHFGSLGIDNVVSKVKEMVKANGCKYIFLDHVSMIVSAQENGDERKALDEVMTRLRMLVQETGCSFFNVSHLTRPSGKGHEEGAVTSLSQLRGSASIGQLSDIVIGLERNGQAEDSTERNTTYCRVLKNRYAGITGPAAALHYDHASGRMSEVTTEF